MKISWFVVLAMLASGAPVTAQKYRDSDGKVRIAW
jgi:hypothetical protein